MNGGCCSLFVVDSRSGCDGSSISFVSCCHEPSSTQNQLFPLVDFDSRTNPFFPTSVNADDDISTHSADGTVSVTCVNHLMSDADLPLGTGPLLNFARISDEHHTPSSLSVETSLSHSRLLNVSSSPSPALRQIGSIGQSQKVIGVEVSGCMNHLYGTVCDDMNNGGSVLCLNSSFSRCSTSLEASSTYPKFIFQHRTGTEGRFVFKHTQSSTVSFSHCTFNAVKNPKYYGGAIELDSVTAAISIAACSFVDCSTVTDSGASGGAVYIYFYTSPQPVSISSSFFTGCHAESRGGIIHLTNPQTASVADSFFVGTRRNTSRGGCLYIDTSKEEIQIYNCMFRDSNASFGGALNLASNSSIIISFSSINSIKGESVELSDVKSTIDILNCEFIECNGSYGGAIRTSRCQGLFTVRDTLFDKCKGSWGGGGMYIDGTPSIKLDNLKFRACIGDWGKDVALSFTMDEVVGGNLITNCISTSGPGNVFLRKGSSVLDSTLIPQVDSIDVPSITLSASLDGDDVGGTVTVTTSENVDGRMLVVLDNSGSDYEKPNLDSPPPIARLFVFDFSSSQTASQSVLFNEWNLLQYEANYSMTMAWLVKTDITLSPSLLQTPNPARIVEVITDCSSSQPQQLSFQLKGLQLSPGNYIVKVKDVSDLSIRVSFSSEQTDSSESRNMHSTTAAVFIFGEGSKLTFNTKYEIQSVEKEGEQSPLILDPPRLFFTTPNPTRLTSVSDALFANALDKSTVSIHLSGINIPTGSYSLNVSLIGEQPSPEITLSASFSSSDSGQATAIVFKRDGSQVDLLFGERYQIHSLSNNQHTIWIPSPLSFSVPECPGIVERVSSCSLNGPKSSVLVTFEGCCFVTGPTHVVVSDGWYDVRSNGDLTVLNSTHFTVSFTAGWAQTWWQVAFGQTYSVKSASSLSDSYLVRSSPTLNIPTPPCVTDITCEFGESLTHFVVTFTGQDLQLSGTYTALLSSSASFEVSFSEGVGMSETIEGNPENDLLFGRTYTLSSLSQGNDVILLNKTDFSTPTPPFVNAASFEFVNGMKTSCKLVLGGTDLAMEGEFKITLEPPLSIIVPFSSALSCESDELRVGWSDTLQYGQNYTIKSIARSISEYPACFVDSEVNFTTEPKPASILLFVNSSGSSSLLCGDLTRPCSSMDVGLSIVSGIGFARSEVQIVEKGTQNTAHSMSSGSVLSMSASSTISATLEIGSMTSASMGSRTGLFIVSSGRLEFHEISVSILPTDPSFVLVSGSNSTLVLKNSSFYGHSSDSTSRNGDTNKCSSSHNSESSETSDFVCDWSTGLFQLSNCTTTIDTVKLHDLSQGAINMKNGTVDIETSTFHNNGHRHSSFPSAGQNIHCSDGGVVKVGSLLGGDGSSDTHSHLWIAADECKLSGDEIQTDHPRFIPTLSTKSSCTLNKKEKAFQITILGSILIPCGLWLEVFEVGKDANVEKSKKIELTENSTLSFTETNITFSLPQTSHASLDSSLEWRGRLVFGEEQRTAESFLIQSDSSSRMAQSVKDNMKWWIPLVVVLSCLLLALILVVVLCRHRHSKKEETKTPSVKEVDEQEPDIEKMEEDLIARSDKIVASSDQNLHDMSQPTSVNNKEANQPTVEPRNVIPVENRVEAMSCGGEMKTVVVNKMETLYERLHSKKMVFARRPIEQMIVRGMTRLMEKRMEETGLRLSSHWVLFDSLDQVYLKMGNEAVDLDDEHAPTITQPKVNEDVRWQAPEQKRREDGEEVEKMNAGLVSVFRLGLVLYEIETGLVPFGEMDEVNACRALHSGTLPKMDGVDPRMAELISSCLSLTPAVRPSLSAIAISLSEIPESNPPKPSHKSIIS
ncbi:hypothetical protein BLNAU_9902 [Blattamonas nauphoetae]|uniref:Protein kinase domain-containing protein n=1 Tax=Blattamonas nauphoetae TaxID=2049346 RepID=A0ABQ9XUL6_9EUKA|nr:hypothetical protein BLNAU_9902 [Blattamonas nauphoetae]